MADNFSCGSCSVPRATGDVDDLTRHEPDASGRAKNETVAAMSSGCPTRCDRDLAFAAAALKSSNGDAHALGGAGGHLGLDEPGCDGVGGDPELAELDRQGLGEALEAGLRGGVVGLAAVAERGRAGEVDDPAPAWLRSCTSGRPCVIRNEPRRCTFMTASQSSVGHLEEQVVAGDAGVVDQHGRGAELARRPGPRRSATASSSATSTPTASALPPDAVISSTTGFARCLRPGPRWRRRGHRPLKRLAIAPSDGAAGRPR